MKYEITEDLYAQFLNTIGSNAAATRYPGNSGTNRNSLSQLNSSTFSAGRPYRAQNWLSYADFEAVLDWSCLRPMTELEYEKACRGGSSSTANGAQPGEYPWQSTTITQAVTLSGAESGTETFSGGANCSYGMSTCCTPYTNGDAGYGPVRAGIFATSSSGEQSAGATYYGIMEMGGNVREYVVSLHGTATADTLIRNLGDGNLQTTAGTFGGGTLNVGDANVATWPQPNAAFTTTCCATIGLNATGQRGGSFYDGANYVQTSDRSYTSYPNNGSVIARQYYSGGRGIR
jgi:formylglycine-generating enzyme required for sulfatase activity